MGLPGVQIPVTLAGEIEALEDQLSSSKKVLAEAAHLQELASETTPLLQAALEDPSETSLEITRIDPKKIAEERGKKILLWLTGPLLAYIPDVEQYGEEPGQNQSILIKILMEVFILAKHAGPLFFTLIQEHSVLVAPTISLGQLSSTALAASTIANMFVSITGHSIIQGFTSALDHFLTVDKDIAGLWCQRTAIITSLSLVFIIQAWFHAESIFLSLKQDPEVARLASSFLKYTALGLPAYAFNEIIKRYLTSQGRLYVITRIMTLVAPINVMLNYILVDGETSYRLGFIGAPVSMAISYNTIAFLTMVSVMTSAPATRTSSETPSTKPPFSRGMLTLIRAGLGGLGKTVGQVWSKDLVGLAASMLGPISLASQAVLLATSTTIYQAPRGLNTASSARVKHLLSKGDTVRAKIAAIVALLATFFFVAILSNVLLASAGMLGGLFSSDPVIIQNVASIVPVLALFSFFHGLGAWVDSMLGTLGKSAAFPALNASADYFSGFPLGLYLAFGRHWGLSGLWAGLTVSLIYSIFAGATILLRSDWSAAPTMNVLLENGKIDGVAGVAILADVRDEI